MTYRCGVDKTNHMMTSLVTIALSVIISFHIGSPAPALAQPSISEPNLTAELVLDGLSSPTSIAFLDENNILLLEKEGSVRLISNGQLQPQPVLQLQGVESNNERGLLGIEVMGDKVFLYVTESEAQVEGIPSEGESGTEFIVIHGTVQLLQVLSYF
jgi:glucose/arabinose dehydrogenase